MRGRGRGWSWAVLLAALLLAAVPFVTRPGRAAECPRAPLQPLRLPRLYAALAQDRQAMIVALGSSTTQGWRASDAAHSYPAVLQTELTRAWPHAHVAVVNRGIGGQDAPEELSRLHGDVLALRPDLVIWQVGANGVLRDVDPAVFRKLVSTGLGLLREAGTDVILMDNQRAPMILAQRDTDIDRALAEMAAHYGVNLYSRAALMDAWQAAGAPYGTFLDKDGLHHNDLGYRCLGRALAASIVEAK